MEIRRANKDDILQIMGLLQQVLTVHAQIRPDIFIEHTTKFTEEELLELIENDERPIFVAIQDETVLGHCFCEWKKQPNSQNMMQFDSIYIHDLCVDEKARGKHVGSQLLEYVKALAKSNGCYEVTLNVWAGNQNAEAFYEYAGFTTQKRTMEFIL